MKSVSLSVLSLSIVVTVACTNETNSQTAISSTAELNTAELATLRESPELEVADTPVNIVEDSAATGSQGADGQGYSDPQIAEAQDTLFPWRPSDGDQISFKVLRKGNDFGTHSISFSGDPDDELIVTTEVSLRVGLGPITAFRYTLEARETWRDGVLVHLTGETNDNGDRLEVSADQQGDALNVSGSEYSGFVELGILPSSHWHKGQVKAPQILSTEDGELLNVSSEFLGRETVDVAGTRVDADRYLLKSDIDLDLWYDDQNRLVKLAFEARGQNIEYVLTEMYGT